MHWTFQNRVLCGPRLGPATTPLTRFNSARWDAANVEVLDRFKATGLMAHLVHYPLTFAGCERPQQHLSGLLQLPVEPSGPDSTCCCVTSKFTKLDSVKLFVVITENPRFGWTGATCGKWNLVHPLNNKDHLYLYQRLHMTPLRRHAQRFSTGKSISR